MGEPLKLKFQKEKYGSYAEALNHVLQSMEGHFNRGYGDRSRDAEIYLLPKASEEATHFLDKNSDSNETLERVKSLIEGFETPYGMELLASVHWITQEYPEISKNVDKVIEKIHAWNERKKNLFKPRHIEIALNQLIEKSWIPSQRVDHT